MQASAWEFKFRAFIFGGIFLAGVSLTAFFPRKTVELLADGAEAHFQWNAALTARAILLAGATLLVVAAQIRTWASGLKTEIWYWSFPALLLYLAAVLKDAA